MFRRWQVTSVFFLSHFLMTLSHMTLSLMRQLILYLGEVGIKSLGRTSKQMLFWATLGITFE